MCSLGNKVQMRLSQRRGQSQKIFSLSDWISKYKGSTIQVEGKYSIAYWGPEKNTGAAEQREALRKKIVGTATTKCNGEQHPTCEKCPFCDCCWGRRPGNGTAGFYWTSVSGLMEEDALSLSVSKFQSAITITIGQKVIFLEIHLTDGWTSMLYAWHLNYANYTGSHLPVLKIHCDCCEILANGRAGVRTASSKELLPKCR